MKTAGKLSIAFVAVFLVFFVVRSVASGGGDDRMLIEPVVHDPVLAEDNGVFYLYCTGENIACFSSRDLEHWRSEPPVFSAPPEWALRSIPGYEGHTWAPDRIYHDGVYHLCYSCSSFGRNTSAIGHAVREVLDPADTSHVWRDTGPVVRSTEGENNYNAIDPSVFIDDLGVPWMVFGSFWGGIQLIRLTDDLTAQDTSFAMRTVARRSKGSAIEAPFLFKHGDYYYLFVSFDYCCRGLESNYNVVVGRSERIEGPYFDRNGREMATGGGTAVVSSDPDFVAIGHCAVYTFGKRDYFVAHGYSRTENGLSKLFLRELCWDDAGWPFLG